MACSLGGKVNRGTSIYGSKTKSREQGGGVVNASRRVTPRRNREVIGEEKPLGVSFAEKGKREKGGSDAKRRSIPQLSTKDEKIPSLTGPWGTCLK